MCFTTVESSTLATVAYDQDRELLELEFRSRTAYRYFAVPAAVHEVLLAATSKGRYFNQAIRGRYRFVRVVPLPATAGVPNAVPFPNQRGTAWPAR
ncbi:MAG: KTSC domain-containing protein [Bryobacterales bacterium]|nr:KTSC domain-containing protein [Bryobacterales bacterium]